MPDLRDEFEALMRQKGWGDMASLKNPDGSYVWAQSEWEVYQAATERAAKNWQPIETAPRDGTKFLALRRNEIAVAWVLVRDDGDIWNFGRSSACPEVFPSIAPTHWMPLPDEPDAAAIRAREGKGGAG